MICYQNGRRKYNKITKKYNLYITSQLLRIYNTKKSYKLDLFIFLESLKVL